MSDNYLSWLTAQLAKVTDEELQNEIVKDPVAAVDNYRRFAAAFLELEEAVKSLAWSVLLADHVGDVWGPMERLLEAAGLPGPLEDSDDCWILPFPVDPNYPDDEADRYSAALKEVEK